MLTLFFIRRPIVACVISILIVLLGLVSYLSLPVAQNPDITPPVISVRAAYPGASASVVADTVAAPIEQQVNGVERMLYMQSTSASDGSYELSITFEVGTDIDIATVLVQNRVNAAMPQLPEEVQRQGVRTNKKSSNIVSVAALTPVDEQAAALYDDLYISNYLIINVNDEVKRIRGVGDTGIYPSKDYGMRIWLDPDKLKSRDMTVTDVIAALREQNVQVAAGSIGEPPALPGQAFQYTINTLGRLEDAEQFENVIVKVEDKRLTRVRDIGRVELGAKSYGILGRTNGVPGGVMVVYQSPDGNAVEVAKEFRELLDRERTRLPPGLDFRIIYDTSEFVVSAIDEVYHTLAEAVVLVLLVVLVFLGSFRSTLIPLAAVPVSIIGSFIVLKMLGFTVNLPVLFGVILAIGIVVDDAIIVVENVERIMQESHLPRRQATAKAMIEVFGAIIAISIVLMAVFIPTAALPGISGSIYRQFAVTIAVSTFFSAVCAVTLSPALAGVLIKEHKPGQKPSRFNRVFNAVMNGMAGGYAAIVRVAIHPAAIVFSLVGFAASLVLVGWTLTKVPTGFVPDEDKGLILTEIWMPPSTSQQRTVEAVQKVEAILATTEGVANFTALPGLSLINGNGSNYAIIFSGLEAWDERLPDHDLASILASLQARTSQIPDGIVFTYYLPPIEGLGNAAGLDLRILDRGNLGRDALQNGVQDLAAAAAADPRLASMASAYRAGVPQLFANIDREKVKKLNIPLQDVFSTLSAYLGSAYVNDFNRFGRTWQVNVQAEPQFRAKVADVGRLQVRNAQGQMIPLGSLLTVEPSIGADRVIRYNLYPAAAVNGSGARGVSSGDAIAATEELAAGVLPPGLSFEWTAMSYQEKAVAGQAAAVFAFALLAVYLILAALYENWLTPLAVVLTIPLAVLGAMLGLMARGMDNNIYTQVGLVLLVGLGAKNAILIVEFARIERMNGLSIREAAIKASRLRLRPILMTAFAFIVGVLPLVTATGAGAASRQALGTSVFFGMIGNTILGLFFTPVLFVVVTAVSEKIFGVQKAPEALDIEALTKKVEHKAAGEA